MLLRSLASAITCVVVCVRNMWLLHFSHLFLYLFSLWNSVSLCFSVCSYVFVCFCVTISFFCSCVLLCVLCCYRLFWYCVLLWYCGILSYYVLMCVIVVL